jgi:hypothetical protein
MRSSPDEDLAALSASPPLNVREAVGASVA